MSVTDYTTHHEHMKELMGKLSEELPGPMSDFMQLHKSATQDGALSTKTKELIALAIGINVRCDGCIGFHVHDALNAGASRQEVLETIGVAVMMGGGPSVMYGAEAYAALDQFSKVEAAALN